MFRRRDDNDLAVLVSLNQAAIMTSMSRTMVNAYRTSGRFPAAVDLGDRRVAFVKSEVMDWIQKKIEARIAEQVRKQR
ncbi:AlpA family phage regulatory protein [Rhizobiaceae bacterium CRRU44]|uniref:AlpA family phage regulatory protein n=1 Tax=Ferranicluibacter rubi TaxID=2715133 RepID=A0AA44C9K0_9HYPH|nr:AlpA family phage regulatory protein [Ferranicluibacter rubi]NHT75095.1 AlpA family phage regulatory protein [Ferranicluibacter rubi]